jgi:hypothetical protein
MGATPQHAKAGLSRASSLLALAILFAIAVAVALLWRAAGPRRGATSQGGPAPPPQRTSGQPGQGPRAPASRAKAHGPASLDLIAAAEKKGELDLDTAWTYRFQALFEPELLPARFQSPTPLVCGTGVMRDFQGVRSRLRPETLANLRPYLVRPDDPESVFVRASREAAAATRTWRFAFGGVAFAQAPFTPTTESRPDAWDRRVRKVEWPKRKSTWKVTVHARPAAGTKKIEEAVGQLDRTTMYYLFKDLLAVEPPTDSNEVDSQGRPDNGGDGDLDIYLVPDSQLAYQDREHGPILHARGMCVPTRGDQVTPSWILVQESLAGNGLGSTIAHELFHAFQKGINQDAPLWWIEATAVWAQDYTDRKWDTEHEFVYDAFLVDPLPAMLDCLTREGDRHEYGAYIFPFYLSSRYEDKLVGTIWQECGNNDPLDVVDANVPRGLDENFKAFALLNYDDVDFSRHYRETLEVMYSHGVDDLELCPAGSNGAPGREAVHAVLFPLSARYVRIVNGCGAPGVSQIRFDLAEFVANPKLSVQAIINPYTDKLDEDWTGREERVFCINQADDTFLDIAIVLASAERTHTLTPTLKIELKHEACAPPGGTGKFQVTKTESSGWSGPTGDRSDKTSTATGTIVFQPYEFHGIFHGTASVHIAEKGEYAWRMANFLEREIRTTCEGTASVPCKLEYAWGEEDAGYTIEFDQVPVTCTERKIDYYARMHNKPDWDTTRTYQKKRSIQSTYLSSFYGGAKPKPLALLLEGQYVQPSEPKVEASWSFRLTKPRREGN